MHIIIVGGGRTGAGLAERLIELGNEIVIIEADEDRVDEIYSELDAMIINGDGREASVLEDAGIDETDAIAILTPNDEVNMMICKIADMKGVPHIVTRVNQGSNAGVFSEEGADVEISMVDSSIMLFEKAVTGPEIYGIMSFGGKKADVIEVKVREESDAEGRTIADLDLPELISVAMITRGDELIPPRGSTRFEEGDRVILVGEGDEVTEVGSKYFSAD